MSMTTLANLQEAARPAPIPAAGVAVSLETVAGFESMQRVAKLFASSSIVPKTYQGKMADCFIAVDMAMRMGANPLMVMQNLYLVHGNPAWSAQFLIATFNKSGKFSALRYEFQGKEGQDEWGCRAVAVELASKEKLVGPLITIGMAKKEGWYSKKDKFGEEISKWQTMPEQMLRYRAAAWFIRVYAPEIAMGIQTAEEMMDKTIEVEAITEPVENGVTLGQIAEEVKQAEPVEEKPRRKLNRAPKQLEPAATELTPQEPELLEPQPPTVPKLSPGDILCPMPMENGAQRIVDMEKCDSCQSREGCPAHNDSMDDMGL